MTSAQQQNSGSMRFWMPYITGGSGTDVFTEDLAHGLREAGHEAVTRPLAHHFQYWPWALSSRQCPPGIDIILTNSWNGFAFKQTGKPMIVVEHLFVHDPAYRPYRSLAQSMFHNILVKGFERASFHAADRVVAVSHYTASAIKAEFPFCKPAIIHNGIDTGFFCPSSNGTEPKREARRTLLFVGNPTRRKGADLLAAIAKRLGNGFELQFTTGLQNHPAFKSLPNVRSLGRLDREKVREAYRNADLLIFPSRLEGLPLTVLEAMACGTPVVAAAASSLPEVIDDKVDGRLCDPNDIGQFCSEIQDLTGNPSRLEDMGRKARRKIEGKFSRRRMIDGYVATAAELLSMKRN